MLSSRMLLADEAIASSSPEAAMAASDVPVGNFDLFFTWSVSSSACQKKGPSWCKALLTLLLHQKMLSDVSKGAI